MEFITLTKENLDSEHICCAIANNRDCQVAAKKEWLRERLDEGLVFLKGAVRGKCFIEYLPAERAWAPIEAPGYVYIDCLWVSGQFKGQGNGDRLLDECIRDSQAQGKAGLAVLSSRKKQPFLSDPKYLRHRGFQVADTALPAYELLYLPFGESPPPRFRQQVKRPAVSEPGWQLCYSHQCPYTAKYVPLLAALAAEAGQPFQALRLQSAAEAQNAPAPFTPFSLFYNGQLITHEILSEKKFTKLLNELSGLSDTPA